MPGFLKLFLCRCLRVCMFMCTFLSVSTYDGINNQWLDVVYVNRAQLNKFFSSYIATVVSMVNECVLGIYMQCGNQSNKSKVALYKVLIHYNSH